MGGTGIFFCGGYTVSKVTTTSRLFPRFVPKKETGIKGTGLFSNCFLNLIFSSCLKPSKDGNLSFSSWRYIYRSIAESSIAMVKITTQSSQVFNAPMPSWPVNSGCPPCASRIPRWFMWKIPVFPSLDRKKNRPWQTACYLRAQALIETCLYKLPYDKMDRLQPVGI